MGKKALASVVVALLCLVVQAFAGEYHVNGYLNCADCHTMHYSMHHDFIGGSTGLITDSKGPFPMLLKSDPNHLCLICHNGTGMAPDVLGANSNPYVRQGGGLNTAGLDTGYAAYKGHTLGSTATAPGGTWDDSSRGLLCVDCHAPHGIDTQYRNLWTSDDPSDKFYHKSVSYAVSQNDSSKDVFIQATGWGMEGRYGARYVKFNEPNAGASAYAGWCASCHTNFHGDGGSANMGGAHGGDAGGSPWLRHPAADVNIGQNPDRSSLTQYQSHLNRVQVMSTSGNWDSGTDLTPSCFSCHKAHGNKNAFGLIYMRGTGAGHMLADQSLTKDGWMGAPPGGGGLTEEGDAGTTGTLVDLCQQCHVP